MRYYYSQKNVRNIFLTQFFKIHYFKKNKSQYVLVLTLYLINLSNNFVFLINFNKKNTYYEKYIRERIVVTPLAVFVLINLTFYKVIMNQVVQRAIKIIKLLFIFIIYFFKI